MSINNAGTRALRTSTMLHLERLALIPTSGPVCAMSMTPADARAILALLAPADAEPDGWVLQWGNGTTLTDTFRLSRERVAALNYDPVQYRIVPVYIGAAPERTAAQPEGAEDGRMSGKKRIVRNETTEVARAAWANVDAAAERAPQTYKRSPTSGIKGAEEQLAAEILAELQRARTKFPGDNVTTLALVEEVGELAKATFEEGRDRVRKEAVQVATMAMRVVLDGDSTLDEWRQRKGLDPLLAARAEPQEGADG